MNDLRASLRARLEWGAHPLALERRDAAEGFTRLWFRTASGEAVRGAMCRPEGEGPHPAVLVIHAHGNRHDIGCDELTRGRTALVSAPGPALAAAGYVALCLDMPCFGARAGVAEGAAAKAALWRGGSLAGQMVGECASALGWLGAQPFVRGDRLGVFGISMGATLGYWLAGIDDRVRALVQMCCLADFGALIRAGAHDLHGPYLTVPGLLGIASNGVIAGMVAPRAQFVGLGARDPLTPPEALRIAVEEMRAGYGARGGRLVVHLEPEEGQRETDAMRAAAMAFLAEDLGG